LRPDAVVLPVATTQPDNDVESSTFARVRIAA
jgi:hypothetical protein